MKRILSVFLTLALCLMLFPVISRAAITRYIIKSAEIEYTILPGEKISLTVNSEKAVTWSSKNKKIATVTKKGVVTGVNAGTTVITAKTDSKKYKCTIVVYGGEDIVYEKDISDGSSNGSRNTKLNPDSDYTFETVEESNPENSFQFTTDDDDDDIKAYNNFCKEWISESKLSKWFNISVYYKYEDNQLILSEDQQKLIVLENVPADLSGGDTYTSDDIQFKYVYGEIYFNKVNLISKGIEIK